MKQKFIFLACALFFFACQNKGELKNIGVEKYVQVDVSLAFGETKTLSEEMSVHNAQIFVFDESDVLEAFAYVEEGISAASFRCTPGLKKVVAITNAPSMEAVASYADLASFKSDLLEDNRHGSLLMVGELDYTVSAGTASQTITVHVARKVAKVVLNSLTVDFDTEHYADDGFYLSGVYLVNVAGSLPYLSEGDSAVWYNKGCLEEEGNVALLSHVYEQPLQVNDQETHWGDYVFYAYPNSEQDVSALPWSPRSTRLVVEAMIGQTTYFYPVTIPEVVSDHVYKVNLTVRRPGSASADDSVEVLSIGGSVVVEEWVSTDVIDTEI